MIAVRETAGFVVVELGGAAEVAGWAIVGGGLGRASRVVIHGVRNEDLPVGIDAAGLLRARLREAGLDDAVGMMTSRRPLVHHRADSERDGTRATVIVTAGLSNALCVGDPSVARADGAVGTINVVCFVDAPLTESARLEALSIIVEARTLAVLEAGVPSIRTGTAASGTGTDCVTLASPQPAGGAPPSPYAGKHTAIGEVVGSATLAATREAVARWREERAAERERAVRERAR